MGFVLPHTLRIFRLPRMYNRALIISILLLGIGIAFEFDESYDCLEKRNLLYPSYGILFLILYKIADNFIQKRLGRNMFYLTLWQLKDEESIKSTNLENLIQYINMIATFSVPYFVSWGIIKLSYSC